MLKTLSTIDIDLALEDPEFNKAFWEWFDSLPKASRDKFNSYPSDMAKINYFNSVWRKKVLTFAIYDV